MARVPKLEAMATRDAEARAAADAVAEMAIAAVTSSKKRRKQMGTSGKRLDATGFYCLGARYYEYRSGRFLSPS